MNFNRETFAAAFISAIDALSQSEAVTKRELRALSRDLLVALHEGCAGVAGDNQYMNKLLQVLTPVNRKVAVVFFRHFSGFSYDDKLLAFTKKSKKRYDQAHRDYVEFIAEPANNIWTWAERNIEVEQKPFDGEKLQKAAKAMLARAGEAGFQQSDVLKAFIKNGLTLDTIIECLASADGDKEKILENVADAMGFDTK